MEQQKEEERQRWCGLLSEQKESGKSIAGFCRDRGLPVWQFYEWKKRLRSVETTSFVAVEVIRPESLPRPAASACVPGTPIEIRLRGERSLLVGPDFEA